MKIIEEHLGREDTKNKVEEVRFNVRINKYGCLEDNNAYEMIKILKEKNINLSKHIRLLLSLEYNQQIFGGLININTSPNNNIATTSGNETALTYDVSNIETESVIEYAEADDDEVF